MYKPAGKQKIIGYRKFRVVYRTNELQGGPKKVSLIIFAITLSTASQFLADRTATQYDRLLA